MFKVDPTGRETVLYSFTGGSDSGFPQAGLIRDGAGNLYGTTGGGEIYGSGAVIKLDATGKESVLHTFGGGDGDHPFAPVFRDAAGSLYGTTYSGGTYGFGVVFKLDTTDKETVLYNFTGGADGGFPYASVVQDSAAHLYGTTSSGGAYGRGTVFELDATGKETVLYSFTGGADGDEPATGLVRDGAGNLYGTTGGGGTYDGGVLFRLDSTDKETVLYSFTGGRDGGSPNGPVVRDGAGNFYGTTWLGGAYNHGAVFEVSAGGTETVLHSFKVVRPGESPRQV